MCDAWNGKSKEYAGISRFYDTRSAKKRRRGRCGFISRLPAKHLDGEIWELRPLRDRILFVCRVGGGYVLLHHFMKKTQKTPAREIEKAKRELADLIERGVKYE